MDVLNAVRVRVVWNVRLWRTSAYVPFYSGDSLASVLGRGTNITPNLPQPQKYWLDIKTAPSVGLIMKNSIVNYWSRAGRPMGSPRAILTAFACSALKNPRCNAIAG